jgi:hypothetical protein
MCVVMRVRSDVRVVMRVRSVCVCGGGWRGDLVNVTHRSPAMLSRRESPCVVLHEGAPVARHERVPPSSVLVTHDAVISPAPRPNPR